MAIDPGVWDRSGCFSGSLGQEVLKLARELVCGCVVEPQQSLSRYLSSRLRSTLAPASGPIGMPVLRRTLTGLPASWEAVYLLGCTRWKVTRRRAQPVRRERYAKVSRLYELGVERFLRPRAIDAVRVLAPEDRKNNHRRGQ